MALYFFKGHLKDELQGWGWWMGNLPLFTLVLPAPSPAAGHAGLGTTGP